MLKHIYRAIFLVAIFAASLWYFGQNIKESVFHIDTTAVMSDATFPVVSVKQGDRDINLLHGYASNLNANLMRESITVLDSNQCLYIDITENQSTVKKVNYEVRNTFDNSLIENGSYSALGSTDTGKRTKIKINEALEKDKEYALKITAVTSKSKKINYYTRIMVDSNYYLNEKLDFVMQFHDAILKKSTAEQVESYIEPNSNNDNKTLNYVNINSSLDLVSFGSMKPEVISTVVPTVKEISSDISSIMLDYYIKGTTNDGEEVYHVKEFYRVKYTPARMYLLNYERWMEADFDVNLMSLSKSEFKIGISNKNNIQTYMDSGQKNLCFVRNGELWYYNLDTNRCVRVFSFRQNKTDYIRDVYDEHQIRVLNINVEGNIDFIVYGYMNRGLYEGRVGIVLYRYNASNDRVEELVYIPSNEPYDILKEKIGDFSYLTYNDIYYFLLNKTIYSYNIISKGLTELATGITSEDYVFSKEGGYIAWQQKNENGYASQISVLHLENGKLDKINPPSKEKIRLLGIIDENIIYGFTLEKDGYTSVNGEQIVPVYEVFIADSNCKVLKKYKKRGLYVTHVIVSDNVVQMQRVKKENNTFMTASVDHILNEEKQVNEPCSITPRSTKRALTEYYLSLPDGFEVKKLPKVEVSVNTVSEDDKTLRLNEAGSNEVYYVYAYGQIQGSYSLAGEAVAIADEKVGCVINQDQQIVWARGSKNTKVNISIDHKFYADQTTSSYDACIKMMKDAHISKGIPLATVFSSQKLMESSKALGATMINLTGASLDQIFYYINRGIPVIAAENDTDMILITGYDATSITFIDPTKGTSGRLTIKSAEELFSKAGNVFLSVIA